MSDPGLVYLACPFSHANPDVCIARFAAVNRVAALLMRRGLPIYSPISYTHPIALAGDLPTDWAFWEPHARAMLRACAQLLVLTLDGWRESVGVQAEIGIARELGLWSKQRKGKKHPPMTEETRRKLSEAKTGTNGTPWTEEHRRKIYLAKGIPYLPKPNDEKPNE